MRTSPAGASGALARLPARASAPRVSRRACLALASAVGPRPRDANAPARLRNRRRLGWVAPTPGTPGSSRARGALAASRAALPEHVSGLSDAPPGTHHAARRLPTRENVVFRVAADPARSRSPPPSVTVTVGAGPLVLTAFLACVASVAACGAAFLAFAAPALRAMESASIAAERAAANTEKAMEEFEKLSAQTARDLPRTLAEMEAAGEEWDELGEELREVLARVERWGQFTGADEALTKITRSVLEEPSRAIEEGVVEAESLVKRLTDDFARTVSQLTDWESRLAEAVDEVAFRETWERETSRNDPNDPNDPKPPPPDDPSARRDALAAARRRAVADAIAVAEAATEQARLASAALLGAGPGSLLASPKDGDDAAARLAGEQAESVASALRDALAAVEEAKEAATGGDREFGSGDFDYGGEEEDDEEDDHGGEEEDEDEDEDVAGDEDGGGGGTYDDATGAGVEEESVSASASADERDAL